MKEKTNKAQLLTECINACAGHQLSLGTIENRLENRMTGMDQDLANDVHNAIEGLHLTQQKLQEVLGEETIQVAVYSPKGVFHGMTKRKLKWVKDLEAFKFRAVTLEKLTMDRFRSRIKPEHRDCDFFFENCKSGNLQRQLIAVPHDYLLAMVQK